MHSNDKDVNNNNADYLKKELIERMQTEPELFDWLQQAALDGLWYWDLENAENEWLSPEFKELFGYTDAEVPNTPDWWQENIFEEDKERTILDFQQHVTSGKPFNQIVRYRHKDGSTVWVKCRGKASFNAEGKPVRMLGAHSDVTQLMLVQQQLKEKEEILDMLRNTSLDGFWDWNMESNSYFLSARWKAKLGYLDDEIPNTLSHWRTLVHPEDLPKADEALERHLATDATYSVVLRFMRKDGTIAHMLAQGVTKKNTHGKKTRMFGTYTDVSSLEEARAARQANEAKTIFLATMSHEIRTPLNAVLGMAEVLSKSSLSDDQRDCLNTLHNSGKHLLSLINNILDFSQIESGLQKVAKAEFKIQTSVRDVVDALLVEAQNKGIGLSFDTSIPAGCKFIGDNERTRQIVFNIVGNAVKFTEVGDVVVSLSPHEKDGCPGVLFEVSDTGLGMSKEQQERIFENFTQGSSEIRRRFGGSGLGLSICRKLVQLMGGTIEVESTLGQGSTFSLWLPGLVNSPKNHANHVTASLDDIILLESGTPRLKDGKGSVSSAIQAAGCNVQIFADLDALEGAISSQASYSTVVVSMAGHDPADLYEFLKRNDSIEIVVIGKSLCRRIMEDYGKRIRRLPTFPTSDEVVEAISPIRHEKLGTCESFTQSHMGRDLRLLLVEDNRINVRVMERLLKQFPCEVEVAWNGQEAVNMAAAGKWDIILMDLIMPVLDGVDATKIIREADKETYIVALTANASKEDQAQCLDAGMNDFLTKPIHVDELGRVLTQAAFLATKREAV